MIKFKCNSCLISKGEINLKYVLSLMYPLDLSTLLRIQLLYSLLSNRSRWYNGLVHLQHCQCCKCTNAQFFFCTKVSPHYDQTSMPPSAPSAPTIGAISKAATKCNNVVTRSRSNWLYKHHIHKGL